MSRIVKILTSDEDSLFKKRRSSVASSTKKKQKQSSPASKSPIEVKSEPKQPENANAVAEAAENSNEEASVCKKPKISPEEDCEDDENSNEVEALDSTEAASNHQPILISIKSEMIETELLNENNDSSDSSAEKQASMSNDTLIKKCESVLSAAPIASSTVFTRKKRILDSFKAASQSPPQVAAEPVEQKRKSDSSVESSVVHEVAVKHSNSAATLSTSSKYEMFKPTIKSPEVKASGSSGSLTQLVSFCVGTPTSELQESFSASNVLSERMALSSVFKASDETPGRDAMPMSNSDCSLLNVNMDLSNDSGNMVQIGEKCEMNASVVGEEKPESSVADKSEFF